MLNIVAILGVNGGKKPLANFINQRSHFKM
jgi:hypothetical protein